MNTRTLLLCFATVLVATGLPGLVHWMLLLPVVQLLQGKYPSAVACSLIIGLVAESFSPWRFGLLTLGLVATVALTQVVITRFLTLSRSIVPPVAFALASVLIALPALITRPDLTALLVSTVETMVVGVAIYSITHLVQSKARML